MQIDQKIIGLFAKLRMLLLNPTSNQRINACDESKSINNVIVS